MREGKKGDIMMDQTDTFHKLEIPTTQSALASKRAAAQYVGVTSRPDICDTIQLIASERIDASQEEYKLINKPLYYYEQQMYNY